jgi:hypothetical protein
MISEASSCLRVSVTPRVMTDMLDRRDFDV